MMMTLMLMKFMTIKNDVYDDNNYVDEETGKRKIIIRDD